MQAWMRDVTMDMLPDSHRQIAEVIGLEATLALCSEYGGMTLYIPKTDSILARVRAQMIKREYTGANVNVLAKKYGLSARTIQTIVSGVTPQIDGQITLDDLVE